VTLGRMYGEEKGGELGVTMDDGELVSKFTYIGKHTVDRVLQPALPCSKN
jgi:hypothetical protein